MGSQLVKNYNISQEAQTTGGFGRIWKIHNANKISKAKELVSIFIFDKRLLDKLGIKSAQKEEILKIIRQEHHSSILQLVEPALEDPKRIVYITEKVQTSLAAAIENGELSKYIQSELDIKIHLLELIEGLNYLNQDAKTTHLGLSPENIYITASGKWKISGMNFSTQVLYDKQQETIIDFSPKPYDNLLKVYPNLSYIAPELTQTLSKCTYKSDIFSLGMMLTNLIKYKVDQDLKNFSLFEVESIFSYRNNIQSLNSLLEKQIFFKKIDRTLQSLIVNLLKLNPEERPTLSQLNQSDFFMDPSVQTISQLQKLGTMDIPFQQGFLANLAKQLTKFETIVMKQSILPQVMPLINNEQLMPQVISIVVEITKNHEYMTKVEYNNLIWSYLKNVPQSKSVPAKSLYHLVYFIGDFYHYVSNEEVQNIIVPLYLKCLECTHFKLQEVALRSTHIVVNKVDYIYTKNKILPRLLQLCLDQQNQPARNLSLQTLRKIQTIFDRTSINDFILPTMEKMRKQGNQSKEINNTLFEMYKDFSENMNSEILIQKGIPQLLPFLMDTRISKIQLHSYSELIRNLIKKVEDDRVKILSDEPPIATEVQHKQPEQQKQEQFAQDDFDFFGQKPIQATPEKNLFEQGGLSITNQPSYANQFTTSETKFGFSETQIEVNKGFNGGFIDFQPLPNVNNRIQDNFQDIQPQQVINNTTINYGASYPINTIGPLNHVYNGGNQESSPQLQNQFSNNISNPKILQIPSTNYHHQTSNEYSLKQTQSDGPQMVIQPQIIQSNDFQPQQQNQVRQLQHDFQSKYSDLFSVDLQQPTIQQPPTNIMQPFLQPQQTISQTKPVVSLDFDPFGDTLQTTHDDNFKFVPEKLNQDPFQQAAFSWSQPQTNSTNNNWGF